MRRIPVDSTAVRNVGFDPDSKTLEVQFVGGDVYRYANVPERHFHALTSGEGSVGRYVNREIRDRYAYKKVR